MNANSKAIKHGFSMIELTIVITIVGVIAAIAVPRFADAGSGRRLSAAKRTLIADIQMVKLRARATSKIHVIKFYTNENKYIVVEGTDLNRDAIIHTRDFDDDPFAISMSRTSLVGDNVVVVSAMGDITPAYTVFLVDNGIEIPVEFAGVSDFGVTPTISITTEVVKQADVKVLGVSK